MSTVSKLEKKSFFDIMIYLKNNGEFTDYMS